MRSKTTKLFSQKRKDFRKFSAQIKTFSSQSFHPKGLTVVLRSSYSSAFTSVFLPKEGSIFIMLATRNVSMHDATTMMKNH